MGILDRDLRKVRATGRSEREARNPASGTVLKQVKYGTKVYTDNAVPYDQVALSALFTML